jgi:hypothetical protein
MSKLESDSIHSKEQLSMKDTYVSNIFYDQPLIKSFELHQSTYKTKPRALHPVGSEKVLQCIAHREKLLERLNVACENFNQNGNEHFVTDKNIGILSILCEIRRCTIDVIEKIVEWRNNSLNRKPFIWNNKNYLVKIQVS